MLVQPATVDRWYREGLGRCWRRRSRRPGRPRIDSACRDLIRRMAAENCLWGAPRIHGELLKLGIAISERTVSRHLRGRPTRRSQTWRTFFANHFRHRTFISPVMFSDARGDDVVVDASALSFRPARSLIDGSCACIHWASVDWRRSLHHTSLGVRLDQDRFQDRTGERQSTGRAAPRHLRLQLASRRSRRVSFVRACSTSAIDGSVRPFVRREVAIGNSKSAHRVQIELSTSSEVRHSVRSPRRVCCVVIPHGRRNIGEAQARLRRSPTFAPAAARRRTARRTRAASS